MLNNQERVDLLLLRRRFSADVERLMGGEGLRDFSNIIELERKDAAAQACSETALPPGAEIIATAVVCTYCPHRPHLLRLPDGSWAGCGHHKKKEDPIPAGTGAQTEFRPWLPPEAMREAWPDWLIKTQDYDGVRKIRFRGAAYRFAWWADYMPGRGIDSYWGWHSDAFAPEGKTWSDVEAMAAAKTETEPEWVLELERLIRKANAERGNETAESDVFVRLARLHNLRLVVLSGEGEAEVPEIVARRLEVLTPHVGWSYRAGKCRRDRSSDFCLVLPDIMLSAIDQAGAQILRGGE